ncbi:hypothetical protein XENOCAPTIV_026125 [Xenoophorus captivus]|uniref:Uncharacterized protein n=1 Tax=Xenoophorus captivus TaxID=1517983 RepID=A0ABV0RUR4_9TELE
MPLEGHSDVQQRADSPILSKQVVQQMRYKASLTKNPLLSGCFENSICQRGVMSLSKPTGNKVDYSSYFDHLGTSWYRVHGLTREENKRACFVFINYSICACDMCSINVKVLF